MYAEGYKIVIYSADGKKKLKTYASTNPYLTFSRKDVKTKGSNVRLPDILRSIIRSVMESGQTLKPSYRVQRLPRLSWQDDIMYD